MCDRRFPQCVRLLLGLLLLAGTVIASADNLGDGMELGAPRADADRTWRFRVWVNDKEVGVHEFSLRQQGEEQWLSSAAEFEYKLMFVTLYRYQHQNEEVWRQGCLARIESSTDANGKDYTVSGSASAEGFEVSGSKGEATLPGCVHTFAYWDPQFLQASQLLNAQNGEYLEVSVSEPVIDSIEVLGRQVDARRYQLTAKELKLDLWYSASGDWLGLQSIYENGRRLRYELMSPPGQPASAGGRL